MRKRLKAGAIARARQLRDHRTDAEGLLWWRLREANRHGYHFRRQVPFRGYILDFAEHSASVAIELDGQQHGKDEDVRRDSLRDQILLREGYLVLRFPNHEIFQDLDAVVDAIVASVDQRRPPTRPAAPGDLPTRGR